MGNPGLDVKVDHFTIFGSGGDNPPPSDGGGGGGCAMYPNHEGNLISYFLPYALLFSTWLVRRRKDTRN